MEKNVEKMLAQMIMLGFDGLVLGQQDTITQDIAEGRVGGVILFDENIQYPGKPKNIENPKQLLQLTTQLQTLSSQNNSLPLLIAVDYEGGKVNRLHTKYGFPELYSAQHLAQLGASQVEEQAHIMARTAQEAGINVIFGPVADLDIYPENPIIGSLKRSFGDDAKEVTNYLKIIIKTYEKYNILSTLKHFPGHGSSHGDTHNDMVDISDTWQDKELLPYELLIKANSASDLIMTGHLINKHLDAASTPATFSHAMLTELLRKKLFFNGLIITDDLQMGAISKNYGVDKAIVMSIRAGADILLFCNQLATETITSETIIKIILKAIKQGEITQERIFESYQRVKNLKNKIIAKAELNVQSLPTV